MAALLTRTASDPVETAARRRRGLAPVFIGKSRKGHRTIERRPSARSLCPCAGGVRLVRLMEDRMLRRFMVEREIPSVGPMSEGALSEAARRSNAALARLSGVQWCESFVTADRTYCIYLADSEAVIREHARLSGFAANRITEVTSVIDPATEGACVAAPAVA
jgi:hypothetical protein